MTGFTFGCDPEVFVRENGKGYSAWGLIPGNKSEPHPNEFGAVQVDGMALEFNTDPVPQNDFDRFNALIVGQIKSLRSMLPDNLSLAVDAVQEFDAELIEAQPDEAKELGCDPDFNAYTGVLNPRPDADDLNYRSGAGHIHFGWGADIPVDNPEHIEICCSFVKMLDATVGMYMTFIDRDPRRRNLYGKAGAFRPKPYGVEYRTPSNVWIRSRHRRKVMHALMNQAISYASSGRSVVGIFGKTEEEIQSIINNGDWKNADITLSALLPYSSCAKEWEKIREEMKNVG